MIKRIFLSVVLALFAISAWAASSAPTTQYRGSRVGSSQAYPWTDSIAASCALIWNDFHATSYGSGFAGVAVVDTSCYATTSGTYRETIGSVTSAPMCSDHVTAPVNGVCPAKCTATAGQSFGSQDITTAYATGSAPGSAIASRIVPDGGLTGMSYCLASCTVQPSGVVDSCAVSQTASAGGYFRVHCAVQMTATGGVCDTSPPGTSPASGTPAPSDFGSPPSTPNGAANGACPSGSVPSGTTSDGMTVCAGSPKPPAAPAPTTTTTTPPVASTDSNGNAVSTSSASSSNSDGSTTTTTTTTVTAPNGTVTTSTSSSTGNSSSGAPGTADRPEDKTDLCKLHPELNICKNSQVQGQCGLITCTGDAIQCATLRAAAAMQCAQQADSDALKATPSKVLGDSILAGTDPQAAAINAAIAGSTVDFSNPNLDTNGFLGGGACFSAKTINFLGQSVTVDFAPVCSAIQPLRYAVLACATILAYLIVARSVLGS